MKANLNSQDVNEVCVCCVCVRACVRACMCVFVYVCMGVRVQACMHACETAASSIMARDIPGLLLISCYCCL